MKRDYSEYKPSEHEIRHLKLSGNKYIKYDYFVNKVRFDTEEKIFKIFVDANKEDKIRLIFTDSFQSHFCQLVVSIVFTAGADVAGAGQGFWLTDITKRFPAVVHIGNTAH